MGLDPREDGVFPARSIVSQLTLKVKLRDFEVGNRRSQQGGSNIVSSKRARVLYLVWDTASRSTKQQYMLETFGGVPLFPLPGHAHGIQSCWR